VDKGGSFLILILISLAPDFSRASVGRGFEEKRREEERIKIKIKIKIKNQTRIIGGPPHEAI